MNTQIETERMVILMKNGFTHWISKETGERLQRQLIEQTSHTFIYVKELGNSINTSEMSGVYTPDVYRDIKRTEAGEYKCAWGTWHTKRDTCMCASQARKKVKEKQDRIEREKENKPLGPQERKQVSENFRKVEEMGILNNPDSMFRTRFKIGNKNRKGIRRSTILEWKAKNNEQEPNILGLSIDEDVL